jgi:hypothetical protein
VRKVLRFLPVVASVLRMGKLMLTMGVQESGQGRGAGRGARGAGRGTRDAGRGTGDGGRGGNDYGRNREMRRPPPLTDIVAFPFRSLR